MVQRRLGDTMIWLPMLVSLTKTSEKTRSGCFKISEIAIVFILSMDAPFRLVLYMCTVEDGSRLAEHFHVLPVRIPRVPLHVPDA